MMRRLGWMGLVLGLAYSGILGQAQDKIVLTLSVPQWFQDAYNADYFADFYAANPGVDVVLVPDMEGKAYPPAPAYSTLDEHLDAVQAYVSSADVLYATGWSIQPESTAAGLWLDLNPLVTADPNLDEANFYPTAWRAFRWDRGFWALPIMVTPTVLTYRPEAFDEAGLTYPAANWTMEQYIEAASALAQADAKGNITQTGCWCDINLMLYGMLGHGLVDSSGTPALEDSQLAEMAVAWATARDRIYPKGGYSSENVPILMMAPWILSPDTPANGGYVIGDLPGGIYGAQVDGFGISAATLYPEAAFRLVKYLAEKPINSFSGFGSFPALRASEIEPPAANFVVSGLDALPEDQQQRLRDAVEQGVVASDMFYFDYVSQAMQQVINEAVDPETALQEAQQLVLQNRDKAAQQAGNRVMAVATVLPTPTLGSDEIVLNFGVSTWTLPNPQDWQHVAQTFAESDPEVGVVNLDTQGSDYQSWQENNECFYLNYSQIGAYSPDQYLVLDPLLDADPDFDAEDFVPGVLDAARYDGKTFAYPLTMSVSALRYHPQLFEETGIPLPSSDWTVSEFVDALNQLAQNTDSDYVIPFAPRTSEDTDWLLLIAAYGGTPIDYRTDPPTWDFTGPANVDAIRQVLDLARAGLIDYQKMGTFQFSGMQKQGALMAVGLNGYESFGADTDAAVVNYPRSSTYGVLSVGSIGGGYIKIDADHPDACYRWISTMAAHPELFIDTMPARLTTIHDPATEASQGAAAVALYQTYADMAGDPQTLRIPAQFSGSAGTYFVHQFLIRAFDAYVLEDADLEQALADAQAKADQFTGCFEALPEPGIGATPEEYQAYSDKVEQCIALVDPDMAAERAEAMGSAP